MDSSLWSFLLSSPEGSVPYPWERCFDTLTEILFYKNRMNGAIIIDLRPRVNLGGGLYNMNNMWQILTRHDQNTAVNNAARLPLRLFRRTTNEHDQDIPILICSNCCTTNLTHLIVPHLVTHCPLCGRFMDLFG